MGGDNGTIADPVHYKDCGDAPNLCGGKGTDFVTSRSRKRVTCEPCRTALNGRAILEAANPHAHFKLIRVDQGWRTGLARCKCGTEFAVCLTVDKKDRVLLDRGQGCPESMSASSRGGASQVQRQAPAVLVGERREPAAEQPTPNEESK